ncbi:MAG: GspE/PulE family protein [Kiritimatiellae bacterium]|nr:GspE/PulE family protein [Kiritimatiellia bacterium]
MSSPPQDASRPAPWPLSAPKPCAPAGAALWGGNGANKPRKHLGVHWREQPANPNVFPIIRDRALARIQAEEESLEIPEPSRLNAPDDPIEAFCDFAFVLKTAGVSAERDLDPALRARLLEYAILPFGCTDADPQLKAPALYVMVDADKPPEPNSPYFVRGDAWRFLTAHLGSLTQGRNIVFLGVGENVVAMAIDCFFQPRLTIRRDSDDTQTLIPTEDQPGDTDEIRRVRLWLRTAINRGASDIHLEPTENGSRLRVRIDGDLIQLFDRIENALHATAVTWVKTASKLDISNHRVPHDGSLRLRHGNAQRRRDIDVRVSTIPTVCGEKLVMRLLDPLTLKARAAQGLEETIWDPRQRALFKEVLGVRDGLVLVTGPTGSGKTTTLNAALFALLREHGNTRNIVTVEDPVEYMVAGTNQIQVNERAELTFARALRSILRQDPDIVLVGEVRDNETARIAVQAALTGHLILCTLHTNDALGSVDRLKDLGVSPFLIGSTVRLFQAQRLIRLLCANCRRDLPESERDKRLSESKLRVFTPQLRDAKLRDANGLGCARCSGTGYRGRRAVMEMSPMTPALQAAIERNSTWNELREAASRKGLFRPMVENAVELVGRGETSLREVESIYLGGEEEQKPQASPTDGMER